jgi:hypothetical protein
MQANPRRRGAAGVVVPPGLLLRRPARFEAGAEPAPVRVFSYTFLRLGRVASSGFEREGIGADKASIAR